MEIVANVSHDSAPVREEFTMAAHCADRAEVGGGRDVSPRCEQYAGVLYRSPSRHSMDRGAIFGYQRPIRRGSAGCREQRGCDCRDGIARVRRVTLERAAAVGGLARRPALSADDLSLEPHRDGGATGRWQPGADISMRDHAD